ncbi:MAG: 30S ribosomal protein S8 [Candidatus Doudnabacteria bacterium CG10_big_fil_rev_8_21_14_0_10_42_18]|uniref:Small ribosomal subunit protein uS8 n=1 Tax=Candidatus Doudnabacteria bacterium CG10_big_fil_rev_8_21_14_0_10_42_18 TaxID=1974552 RepID=A0A2H0VDU4_9BACT|nr:MAG: 30S ribosomal protein S8 [Candidatus Doudnabacteria bacterium CG10_big_fil_rev_8_21_14_0_10_42_18]
MYTDPIADMVIRIKNASLARKSELILPYSKFKKNLAELLTKEGFVAEAQEVPGKFKQIKIVLKYSPSGDPVISGIKRISKPGQRIYLSATKLPRTNSGLGITVISTSRGLFTDAQARKAKVGGEAVCQVW